MQNITTTIELKEAIQLLEIRQAREEAALKEQFNTVLDNLNPVNMIKTVVKDFVSSPDLLTNLLDAGIGLATGIISKKVLVGGSHNPIIKILGTLMEIGVAGIVTKNPEGIKSLGMNLIKRVFTKKKTDGQP